jgi:hypothetical protein
MPLFETEKKPMNETDKLRVGSEHASAALELEELKQEKRDNNSVYRVKIRELEEKIHTLAQQLDEGAFDVQFEVVEVPDDARLMMVIRLKDNDREINVRPMTEVEKAAAQKRKQGDLFDENGDTERPPPNGARGKRPRAARGAKAKKR